MRVMTTAYEQLLERRLQWALQEGSMHFDEKSAVHATLRKITGRLAELEIPYAVAGAMALFFHGFRRFTEDVDILVTPEGSEGVPTVSCNCFTCRASIFLLHSIYPFNEARCPASV